MWALQYEAAVKVGAMVMELMQKSKLAMANLMDPADAGVENVRLKSKLYEMVVSQSGNYTLVVTQSNVALPVDGEGEGGEAKAE